MDINFQYNAISREKMCNIEHNSSHSIVIR